MPAPKVIVVTGASAGIGRATARAFADRGDRVGLLARGEAGLDAAAEDVEHAGGHALAIPTDVADFGQIDTAAARIEDRFGPIDVWVNAAFTSVFSPFHQITPDEFRRVTEVSYLGYVNSTMVALSRMRPRDRGTIVQVGSALGTRAIPLQSAYCGAKHAINGFTESVRTELMHEHSGVHITIAQMPALNTPQFSWVLSKLPRHPQPVPPIYQPELAARAVVYAADHPRRKRPGYPPPTSLQSAYCGAKHAINGFTESVRTELMHEHSNIHITIAQMPAVNTPQFSWVLSRLPHQPQPVPPIYQPELAASAVLYAADHPRRKQYWVGTSTAATILGQRIAPALLDRYLAKTGYDAQQTSRPVAADRPNNLHQPLDGPADTGGTDHGARGIFDDQSKSRDPQQWLTHHTRGSSLVAAAAAAAGLGALAARLRRG